MQFYFIRISTVSHRTQNMHQQRIVVIKWKTDRKIVTAAKQYRARNVMHFEIVATLTYPYQQCFLQITLFTVLPYSRIRHVWVAWNMLRYTRISERDTRSLTKQKFMDSAEFSSSFHRIVEHAHRRRSRCNSCSDFTLKPAVESKLQLAMASLLSTGHTIVRAPSSARHENVLHC